MNSERIDIHGHQQRLDHELHALESDTRLSLHNKELLIRFTRAALQGRTVRTGSRRRLSVARCRKLLSVLKRLSFFLQTTKFEDVSVAQMEDFIFGLEEGKIRRLDGDTKYAEATILDFKKAVRKFYRWLFAENLKRYEELTSWFDTREVLPELHTFTLADAQRMAQALGKPQGRAMIMALFDGGFRAGEIFNVRLHDVTFRPDSNGMLTCFIRVRVSKTTPRTVSLPLATEELRFWIERHPHGGSLLPDGSIQARNPDAPLFTWSYQYTRKVITKLGVDELGQRLYLHRFRHSSATHYAKFLTHYQMCARYGWTMGSRSVQRYVDCAGVLAEDTAAALRRNDRGTSNENSRLAELLERILNASSEKASSAVTKAHPTEAGQIRPRPDIAQTLYRE